jgi:hypothetical protein
VSEIPFYPNEDEDRARAATVDLELTRLRAIAFAARSFRQADLGGPTCSSASEKPKRRAARRFAGRRMAMSLSPKTRRSAPRTRSGPAGTISTWKRCGSSAREGRKVGSSRW